MRQEGDRVGEKVGSRKASYTSINIVNIALGYSIAIVLVIIVHYLRWNELPQLDELLEPDCVPGRGEIPPHLLVVRLPPER